MSFTAADVLALAKAGYNSQQIALLSKAAEAAPAQQPAPQPTPQPTPQPAPQEKTPEGLQNVMEELTKLTGAIQLQNQLHSQQPKAETAEDIIANIINPPKPQNNNNN